MAENDIKYTLELDITNWSRGMDAAIRSVRDFDNKLSSAMTTLDQFEADLNDIAASLGELEDVNIEVVLESDAGDVESEITGVITGLDGSVIDLDVESDIADEEASIDSAISSLEGTSIDLDIESDIDDEEASIDTAIAGLDGSPIEFDILSDIDDEESSIESVISSLDGSPIEFDVLSDIDDEEANIEGAISALDGSTVDVDVESDSEDEEEDISGMLKRLQSLAIVDIVLKYDEKVLSFIDQIAQFTGVPAFFEMDAALRKIEATTGRVLPGTRELITDLYQTDLAQSIDQIATAVATADQLGIATDNIGTATERAFDVMNVTGSEVNSTLRTMQQLVQLGLARDFDDAADILVAGFQSGANRAGDLETSLIRYGGIFGEMGIDGPQALSLITSGLDAGFRSAEQVGQAVTEFRSNMLDMGNQDVAAALEVLDLTEMRQQFIDGEIAGDQFLDSVIQGLGEIAGAAERAEVQTGIFGTRMERVGDAVKNLSVGREMFADIGGLAEESSATIRNDFGGSILAFKRVIQTEMAEVLDETFNFQERIDRAKEQISAFLDEIKSGTGVFEAIEIAFELPGLTEKLEAFQRGLTEVFLSLLVGLAAVIDAIDKIPTIDASSEGVRSVLAGLGGEQFKIDLGTSDDMTEFSAAVETAFSRGVDAFDIADSITDKINNMVASGDIESAFSMIDMSTTLIPATSGMIAESLAAELDKAIAAGDPTLAANFARMLGDMGADPEGELRARVEELRAFNDEMELFGGLGFGMETIVADEARLAKFGVVLRDVAEIFSTIGGAEHEGLEPAIDRTRRLSDEIEGMEGADDTLGETIIELGELETASTTSFGGFFANIQKAATEIEALNTTANTEFEAVTTSIEGTETAVETFSTVSADQFGKVGDDFSILTDSIEQDAARIEYRIDQLLIKWGLLSGMNGGLSDILIPGGGGGGGGTTNNTNVVQNNTFNNQNGAASAGSGQAAANAIRQP